jgi:uncharacterized protein
MPSVYVDTSALARILLDEPSAAAIERSLGDFNRLVASRLLRTELLRVALRAQLLDAANQLIREVALIPVGESILTRAETLPPPTVATLDAIHLATALDLSEAGELDGMMTYDKRLAAGAREHGIAVLSPR